MAEALNVSRALAYRWMASGILPTVRIEGGRSVRVPREALVKWIEENTKFSLAVAMARTTRGQPSVPARSQEQRRKVSRH